MNHQRNPQTKSALQRDIRKPEEKAATIAKEKERYADLKRPELSIVVRKVTTVRGRPGGAKFSH